jgi:hypothetical protein
MRTGGLRLIWSYPAPEARLRTHSLRALPVSTFAPCGALALARAPPSACPRLRVVPDNPQSQMTWELGGGVLNLPRRPVLASVFSWRPKLAVCRQPLLASGWSGRSLGAVLGRSASGCQFLFRVVTPPPASLRRRIPPSASRPSAGFQPCLSGLLSHDCPRRGFWSALFPA